MIKISKMADYAVVTLTALDTFAYGHASAVDIAAIARLPETTVAKVLKLLNKSALVESQRGAQGGYKLVRKPAQITVADILRAIDGPVALTACVEGNKQSCDYSQSCLMKGRWDGVNTALKVSLESITLADMMAPRAPLCGSQTKTTEKHEHL